MEDLPRIRSFCLTFNAFGIWTYLAVKLVRSSVEPLIEIEVESLGGCLDFEVPDLCPPSKTRTKRDKL